MLCPNCGKDVGDKPRLCDDCEKAAAPVEETAPSPEDAPAEDADAPGPENLPAIKLKNQQKKAKKPPDARTADNANYLPKIIAFFVVVLAVAGFFMFRGSGSSEPSSPPGTTGGSPVPAATPAAAATAAPVATNAPASGQATPVPASGTTGDTPPVEISISNAQWKDSLALLDRQRGDVTVAIFTDPLTQEDKTAAATTGAIPKKKNRFVLVFGLEAGAIEFATAAAKSIKAVYTGPEVGAGGLSLSYVIGKKELPVASGLSGKLEAGGTLAFNSKQSSEKTLENGKKVKIQWELAVKAPLVAVVDKVQALPTPEPASSPGQQSSEVSQTGPDTTEVPESTPTGEEPSVPNVAEGELGHITSDEVPMSVKEAYALYYPDTGAISIGFFGQELDDADRAEILKKKIVTTFVNGKRPSMVFGLDFLRKSGEITRQNLSGYSAYFYRDSSGLFFFPGSYDSKSIRRNAKDLQEYEFTVLSGQLKDGATLAIRTAGDNKPAEGQTKLGWNLAIKVILHEVK